MSHFNKLTPAEAERLALLMEEMAEAQQVIGKILRHGYQSVHPNGGPNNRELLMKELSHVNVAMSLLENAGDVDGETMEDHFTHKWFDLGQWLHHNKFLLEGK